MFHKLGRVVVAFASSIALLSSTSAMAQDVQPAPAPAALTIVGKTEVEKAIGKCVGSVVGGALLGALIGAAAKDTGKGAIIGAAAGVGVCAIIMSLASKKDKEQMRALQLAALNSGEAQQGQWQTAEGKTVVASVTRTGLVQVASTKSAEPLQCTRTNMGVSVGGSSEDSYSDVFCLQGDKWVSADKLKSLGVNPATIAV